MIKMTQSGKLSFEDESTLVTKLDMDLSVQNISKPYLMVTLKQYRDKTNEASLPDFDFKAI